MKKIVLGLLLWSTAPGAEPMTYHTVPHPSHQLVTLGGRVVIQDARGFFVGYYKPLPAPRPFVPGPRVPAGQYTGRAGGFYSVFESPPASLLPTEPDSGDFMPRDLMPDYDSYGDCSTAGWSSGGPSCPGGSGHCPSGR